MRQVGLIAGVLLLIAALALLNNGIGKNAQPDDDDDSGKQAQAKKAPPPPAPASGAQDAIPPEQTVGNSTTAKYHVTVGWVYDAHNQAAPAALSHALDAVRQIALAHTNTVAAEIVNLDVPAEARSPAARAVGTLGVTVNGSPLNGMTDNPGEGKTTDSAIAAGLNAAIR